MGGEAQHKAECKKLVDAYAEKVLEMLEIKFGQWNEPALGLAEMLEAFTPHHSPSQTGDEKMMIVMTLIMAGPR